MDEAIMMKTSRTGDVLIWSGQVSEWGLLVKYGKEGKSLRSQTFPVITCTDKSPSLELDRQINQKLKEGYATAVDFNLEILKSESSQSEDKAIVYPMSDDIIWF